VAGDAAEKLNRALADLSAVQAEGGLTADQERAISTGLEALEDLASIGECQMDTPYASMRPVRRPDGTLQWCCNHESEHCV